MKVKLIYSICIIICLCACNNPLGTHRDINEEAAIEDIKYLKTFESKASKYYAKNGGISSETYKEQLLSENCEVVLPSPQDQQSNGSELYSSVKNSVLVFGNMYNCGKCPDWHMNTATAFPISKDGICVSNYHVFESYNPDKPSIYETAFVMDVDKNIYPVVEVLAASKKDDVVIFRVECERDELCPLPIGQDSPNGGEVCLISHPDRRFYTFTQGLIDRTYIKPGKGILRQSMSAAFAKGSSGAPVLDRCGNVVGIVGGTSSVFKDGNPRKEHQMIVKEIIPVSRLRNLIRN